MSYKDRDWLYEEYHEQRRKMEDIASQFGVNRKTVGYFVKKFGIPKPCKEHDMLIEIACHVCKCGVSKKWHYLRQRINEGKTKFHCSDCLEAYYAERYVGENNPNYGGTWYGPKYGELFTFEERSEMAKANIAKQRANGKFEAKLAKMQEGHKNFFETEAGKKLRVSNGVKSVKLQASSKGRRTSIEVKMAEELERREIEYVEQHSLGDKFLIDFYLPEYNIAIECDGDYWHRLPKNVARDKKKNAYIAACGISLYRFWESEINTCVESCVDIVFLKVNEAGS